MSLPTKSEKFSELVEHLRKAQEAAAMLGHLTIDEDKLIATGWRGVAELMGRMVIQVTALATKGRLH